MTKPSITPTLRFPGFIEPWTVKKLIEVAVINPSNKSLPETFIYIDLDSVESGELKKEKLIKKIEAPSRAQRILFKNDILFQMVRPYQMNNLYFDRSGDFVASTGYAQIRTNQNSRYIFQYLHFQKFVDKVIERCTGTSYPAINSTDLSNIEISLPSIQEQTKIADFLFVIDKKIHGLKEKKRLLEVYKKGLMQKIFSQTLRFKDSDGKDFPTWANKKLGDIAEVKRGAASHQLKYIEDKNQGVRLLRINDFLGNAPVYIQDSEEIKKLRVCTNDLLIAGTGATAGIVFIVPSEFNNFAFSYNAPRIRVTGAHYGFIYYYLQSDIHLQKQKGLFVGNAQHFLDTDTMRNFIINIPILPEQVKIFNFLLAIDEKIIHTQSQIEKTEFYKRGLLQKMLC